MMGHREALQSGDEVNAAGSWRQYLHWRPGERKAIKRQLAKRARRKARLALGVSLAALRGFTGRSIKLTPGNGDQNLAL
jgi:hypothetical protein